MRILYLIYTCVKLWSETNTNSNSAIFVENADCLSYIIVADEKSNSTKILNLCEYGYKSKYIMKDN